VARPVPVVRVDRRALAVAGSGPRVADTAAARVVPAVLVVPVVPRAPVVPAVAAAVVVPAVVAVVVLVAVPAEVPVVVTAARPAVVALVVRPNVGARSVVAIVPSSSPRRSGSRRPTLPYPTARSSSRAASRSRSSHPS
jgi:hypothetical protein